MDLEVYHTNSSNTHRYSLGSKKGKVLYVFGVNPSTASPQKLDPTLKNVNSFANILGYDSFMMFNLYPQRATDPDHIHGRLSPKAHQRNKEVIKSLITPDSTIWAAWGNLITHRPFLKICFFDIYKDLEKTKVNWIQYDDLTLPGHPKHPSRKKIKDCFQEFDIQSYLLKLGFEADNKK